MKPKLVMRIIAKIFSGVFVKSKLVQLLLIWFFVLGLNNSLYTLFTLDSDNSMSNLIYYNFNNLQFIVYPFLGIAMDAWSARLKTIKLCVFATSLGLLIGLCCYTMYFLNPDHDHQTLTLQILKWVGLVAFTIPFSVYRTNVVPLYMEQMMDYPSDQVSAVIHWHIMIMILPDVIVNVISTFVGESEPHWFIVQISTLLATFLILPCSYCLLSASNFSDYPHTTNPVKLIFSLIKYSRLGGGNNRSYNARFSSDPQASRLDQGKLRYGGPFKEEEVEDVKMVFRIAPLLICLLGHVTYTGASGTVDPYLNDLLKVKFKHFWTNMMMDLPMVFIILFNLLIFTKFFRRCLPSMLKRIGIGIVLALFSNVTSASIQGYSAFGVANYSNSTNDVPELQEVSTFLYLIPLIGVGVSFCYITINSFEFILAQSPANMRGLLIGLWYTSWGISGIISDNLYYVLVDFEKLNEFYYFVGKIVITCIVLIIFIVCAKRYKRRNRIFYNSHEHDYDDLVSSQLTDFGESTSQLENNYGTIKRN